MNPLFTAFYTRNSLYEAEAARLIRSLGRLGLEHDIRAIDNRGDWIANSKYTAEHICNMLAEYPDRPVVQLDADAVVWERPTLFDDLDADVAVHIRRGVELLNGTVYFGPTAGAKAAAARYRELIEQNPGCTNEQTMLAAALKDLEGSIKVATLPASFCFIPDIMANDVGPDEVIVIAHMQASRSARGGGDSLDRRNKWIVDAEKRLAELEAVA